MRISDWSSDVCSSDLKRIVATRLADVAELRAYTATDTQQEQQLISRQHCPDHADDDDDVGDHATLRDTLTQIRPQALLYKQSPVRRIDHRRLQSTLRVGGIIGQREQVARRLADRKRVG